MIKSRRTHFPPELLDHIFQWLEMPENTASLCACCLVCSTWLPVARENLYATVTSHEGKNSQKTFQRLLHLLTASSAVSQAITHLVIDGTGCTHKLPIDDFLSVLGHLPRLRYLSVRNWRLPTISLSALTKRPPLSLRSLELTNIGFYLDPPAHFFHLLKFFACVDAVIIDWPSFYYAYGASSADLIPSLHVPAHFAISRLMLHAADDRTHLLLTALEHTVTPATLRHLQIAFYDLAPLIPALARLLRTATLQILTIDLSTHFPQAFSSDTRGLADALAAIETYLRPTLQRMSTRARSCSTLATFPHMQLRSGICVSRPLRRYPPVSRRCICAR
jgi:hypothetical protein